MRKYRSKGSDKKKEGKTYQIELDKTGKKDKPKRIKQNRKERHRKWSYETGRKDRQNNEKIQNKNS